MASISFTDKPGTGWVTSGRVFRELLSKVRSQFPADEELVGTLTLAEDIGYISVHRLRPSLVGRVTEAIRMTVDGILSGTIRSEIAGMPLDEEVTHQYHDEVRKLRDALPH